MKLSRDNEKLGTNAQYYLNDETDPRYSASNSVSDAVTGVTVNLVKADPATYVTVSVNQDTSGAVSAVQDFVKQYNSTISLIRDKTAYDLSAKKGEILNGDSTISSIESMLAIMVGGTGEGLGSVARSLADIGITTGAIGSTVGSTDTLQLDTTKLTEKLKSNPSAVADVFGALNATVTLDGGGTGSIASVTGTPDNHTAGSYKIVSDASGNLTVTFTPTSGSPVTRTGTITANGANTTLIPGVSLTAKSTLAAGTDTITVGISTKGIGVKIADYLNSLTGSNGSLQARLTSFDDQIKDMNDSIFDLQTRIDSKQTALQAKFSSLEVALANLQNQSSSLSAQLAKMI
jgi:flagellar hook-associated protein 2